MGAPPPSNAPGPAGVAGSERQMESSGNWVTVGASSPMFTYEPQRNAPSAGWSQDAAGTSSCSPNDGSPFTVGASALHFTDVSFMWTASAECTIFVGLDGQLQPAQASSGSISLNGKAGNHAVRLEVSDCPAGNANGTFQFLGLKVITAGATRASGSNTTIDDADALVQYSGFASTPAGQSQIPDLQNGVYYRDSVSYTSSTQAAASLTFAGPAVYVYGPTGPSFGSYQVALDNTPAGVYNASTTVPTFNTLLFYADQLDTSRNHQITLTNQNEGTTLAIDYFVIATPGGQTQQPFWPGGQQSPAGDDSSGVLVGGILGGLVAALLLFLAFMYWRYRKKGGKGNFWAAFCGPVRKALKVEKKEESQFRPWPMLLYRPKYAVSD